MLPHVGVSDFCETKKAYFLGYMVHRLLLAALGRRELDDRDHYGNKRLDLAGPLLAFLFRGLFKNLLREVRMYAQKFIDQGKDFNLELAIKTRIITDGLKYSLATGNWGDQKKAHTARAGVSQVSRDTRLNSTSGVYILFIVSGLEPSNFCIHSLSFASSKQSDWPWR